MRRIVITFLSLSLLVPLAPAAHGGGDPGELTTNRRRYVQGQDARITLANPGATPLGFESPWRIENAAGETVAAYHFGPDERTVSPGSSVTRTWDGTPNECSSEGCTAVGGLPPAGKYRAAVDTDSGTLRSAFLTGRYFTLGFESRPGTSFAVFVAKQKAVEQMRTEAAAEDKSLIVSGIVRLGRRGYNADWSYYMGPRSVVLGEVFMEVCDGSPYYVQRHRKDWSGQRWCPWSSYVARAGR